jgi:hypothetical protein
MSDYRNCVNCGKQNLIDEESSPTDKCFHCHQPIGVKVNNAPKASSRFAPPAPPAPAAEKAGEETPPPEIYVATGKPRKTKRRGLYKWRKRCLECDLHYVHDEIVWCSSERCPQRCPPQLRPQYRPKVEEHKAKKKAIPAPPSLEVAEDVCAGCPVLEAFKGYRMAVKEILIIARR